jgi:UDP-glucuronate 4-epimerase
MMRDEPISVYPGVRNVHTPLYEDDYVDKTIAAAGIAKVGTEIVNVGGTEAVTTQEYCRMAGEILGKEPEFVENGRAWPIWADTTKMVQLLGSNTVSVREGVRRTIEAAHDRLTTSHHVIGEPTKV